jgi:hypothetical protein
MRRQAGYLLRRMERLEAYAGRFPETAETQLQDFLSFLSDAELLQLKRDLQEIPESDPPRPEATAAKTSFADLSAGEARDLLEFLADWREEFRRAQRGTSETLRVDRPPTQGARLAVP